MFSPSSPPPRNAENRWRFQLDQFVQKNQQPLAALCWGLKQEWGDSNVVLGIDLHPHPHFVACTREAIEELNRNVNNQLREILGILDGHDPKTEVVIIGIGEGQVKLIHFEPKLPPSDCFKNSGDIDTLITELEQRLNQMMEGDRLLEQ
ncbi:MAG: hypothetical protein ACFB4I_02870 [Cyanophyceae cyanobacterium]